MVNGNGVDYSKQSDESLMTSFQEGDERAYTELYERYFEGIVGFCFNIKKKKGKLGYIDQESLEDIAQETFLSVSKDKHMYKRKFKFYGWLFAIARNLLINEYRRSKSRPQTDSLEKIIYWGNDGDPIRLGDSIIGGNLTEELDALFGYDVINKAFKKLSEEKPRYSIPIQLFLKYGFDYVSISKRMGIPLGTVKESIFRGKLRLKEILLDQGVIKNGKIPINGNGRALPMLSFSPSKKTHYPNGTFFSFSQYFDKLNRIGHN